MAHRKWRIGLQNLKCIKCEAINDIDSKRRILYKPEFIDTLGNPPQNTPEVLELYCGVCGYLVETFVPNDGVGNGGTPPV